MAGSFKALFSEPCADSDPEQMSPAFPALQAPLWINWEGIRPLDIFVPQLSGCSSLEALFFTTAWASWYACGPRVSSSVWSAEVPSGGGAWWEVVRLFGGTVLGKFFPLGTFKLIRLRYCLKRGQA